MTWICSHADRKPTRRYSSDNRSMSLVGRKVVIEGLASRPELNGTKGIALSFDDAKGRYNVKLASGAFMALKPASVVADPEAPLPGTGGMPGMGGMGGMPGMGGMGGMPGMMGGLLALLAKLMGGMGTAGGLPGGVSPKGAIMMGAMLVFYVLPRLGLGVPQAVILGGLGLFVYRNGSDGKGVAGVIAGCHLALGNVGAFASRATGRPVSSTQAGVLGTQVGRD